MKLWQVMGCVVFRLVGVWKVVDYTCEFEQYEHSSNSLFIVEQLCNSFT